MTDTGHVTFRDRIREAVATHGGVTALALYVGDRGLPAAPVVGPCSSLPRKQPEASGSFRLRRVHPVLKQKQRR
jgi:hypothetical protein